MTDGIPSSSGHEALEVGFTHLDETGAARIVNVSRKTETLRRALARAVVVVDDADLDGDVLDAVLGEARLAGIMGAKATSSLIPLCHPIRIDAVTVDFITRPGSIEVLAGVEALERTGMEMEAMTACALAALSLVSTLGTPAGSPSISTVELVEKSGGRSGDWVRPAS